METEILLLNVIKTQGMNMKGSIKTFASPECSDLKKKRIKQANFHISDNCIPKSARLKKHNSSTDFPT